MSRLAPGYEWSPSGRVRRIRDWVDPVRDDPRLQQDMEAELAADVEWYDHPTKGRIRLVDELVHPPGSPFGSPAQAAADDDDAPVVLTDDLAEALDALPDERDDQQPVPFYDWRTGPS